VHFFHLFDIERRFIERCCFLAEDIQVGVYQIKWLLNVIFINDYMKNVVETKLQIHGQKIKNIRDFDLRVFS